MKKPFSIFLASLLWVSPAAAQTQTTAPASQVADTPVSSDGPEPLATTDEAAELVRETLERDFSTMLPFQLTEEKMIAFTRAALRVEKINGKWDVQIASVESDKTAMEYNLFAVEEIASALKSIDGLTLDEYQILTALTLEDKKFNKVYQAYRQLVRDKYFPEPPPKAAPVPMPATAAPVTPSTASSIQIPVAAGTAAMPTASDAAHADDAAQRAVTPPAAPEDSGNAPTPQGSPVPPYSPPQSR